MVHFVGAGPGAPDLITQRGAALLQAAEPEQVKEILEARDRSKAGPTAVAKGLTLVEIRYE